MIIVSDKHVNIINNKNNHNNKVLDKRKIVVSTILEAPYMLMKPDSAWLPHVERFEGYLSDIIDRLSESVGFTYDIKLARDGLVGGKLQDGGWTGVIGEVARGEADIGAGAIVVTRERSQVVSFSEPFLSLRSSILLRKAGRTTKKHRLQKFKTQGNSNSLDTSSSSLNRHINVHQNNTRSFKKITSLSQLLQTDYVIGVVKDSASEHALKGSLDPVNRAVWKRIADNRHLSSLVNSLQEGLDRVKRERFALILESPMAEYQATRSPCDLYASEPFLDVLYYSFALHKGKEAQEFRESFNRELAGLKSSDEMQTLYLKWWKDQCFGSHLVEGKDYSEADLNRRYADPMVSSSDDGGGGWWYLRGVGVLLVWEISVWWFL